MPRFQSRVQPGSAEYQANRAGMLALVDELREIEARAAALSEKRRPRFEERGQLLPRERVAALLDPGMPFLQLYGLANYLVDDEDPATSVPGASSIAGIGFVGGVRAMIFASDSGISAGAMLVRTGEKLRACLDIALDKKLPFIFLVESAGANLLDYRVETWSRGGGAFFRMARLSAAGIPSFVILHGPSVAGGAYFPGMADYVIAVKGRGRAALGGAALVRAATGEIADEEDLAGAEMHATRTGSVEYLAEDDADAIATLRDLIGRTGWNDRCGADDRGAAVPPHYDPDQLAGVVPVDYRTAFDMREVVARIVDGSDFQEYKPRYGAASLCCHGAIMGIPCGIVGNNGPFDTQGATKVAQFLQACDQAGLPVIFLNNITGFMVGKSYEHAGMIKHGSKLIQAVSNLRTPRISLFIGASFGAGNYAMCGAAFEPDFLFTWPNAQTGVMGGEQAAMTMEQVARSGAERRGVPVDEDGLARQRARLETHYNRQSHAFYTSGRLLDQGVIDPRDTRRVLGFALETCREARARDLSPNTFGVARQ
ncbi:acyl-CoA carboxylase subunit beta [Paracoccus sp. (in: a-proteobacteria)]|uniref:acyl-CoA carboxylase subunit beta n=1 Tax=Paracoccus sp. TaxID=267 RepID=UPI003A896824